MAIIEIIDSDGVSYTEKEYADHIRKSMLPIPLQVILQMKSRI